MGNTRHRRPRYETQADIQRERLFANLIGDAWKCHLRNTPRGSIIDAIGYRGERVVGYFELKCRFFMWGSYRDIILAAPKWRGLVQIAEQTDLPAIFALWLPDCAVYLKWCSWMQPGTGRRGRTDRGDIADMEQCVLLPLPWFSQIEGVDGHGIRSKSAAYPRRR
jgi:hypothetical protein